ncbi:Sas10/Utp3/C1D family-domain-containing protein [Roridomyces roridus]|uniref:Exosome complex protein n=1 Tax=Roridomyces roridus TaxID=1738132 RepID=A0AAD7C6W8_9AGAR|nr:Sas10/Utp3/C1D family-domain-containing protein [Roridomyces roridus]
MTTETTNLKAKLATLTNSIGSLESVLEPLLAQTLPETTVGLTPIEQAKLQTLIPYLVYDLVFIYLKSKGIDPKTHPVVGELSRVKRYFDKITAAETPEAPRAPLDKAAATRFIKHAITQSKLGESSSAAAATPEPSTFVAPKVTSKMIARAEHEAELRARGDASSSDEELEVIDGEEKEEEEVSSRKSKSAKGKGKAKEVEVKEPEAEVLTGTKRRRPAIDPFAGTLPPLFQPLFLTRIQDMETKKNLGQPLRKGQERRMIRTRRSVGRRRRRKNPRRRRRMTAPQKHPRRKRPKSSLDY